MLDWNFFCRLLNFKWRSKYINQIRSHRGCTLIAGRVVSTIEEFKNRAGSIFANSEPFNYRGENSINVLSLYIWEAMTEETSCTTGY